MSAHDRLPLLLPLALLAGGTLGWGLAVWSDAPARASVDGRSAAAARGRRAPAALEDLEASVAGVLAAPTSPRRSAAPAAPVRPEAEPARESESALLVRIGVLEAEVRSLQTELDVERAQDGTALEAFLRTPDAETLGATERRHVELLLEYLPVHLFAGEPTWIVENAIRPVQDGDASTWDTDDAAVLAFLGRDRVLGRLSTRQLAAVWDTIGGDFPLALGLTRDEAVTLREEIRAAGIEPRMFYSFGDEDL